MDTAFWSHWGWPLATAALGYVYVALLMAQWRQRRKPHQLAWALGFLLYAVAATMEAWSEAAQHWDPTVYRVYIVIAAALVGLLGQGTVYLLFKDRKWGNIYLAYNLAVTAIFLYGTFTTDLGPLTPGITVGGLPLGASGTFPRFMSMFLTIPGSVALLGGSAWSVAKFWSKPEYRYRAWANVLIFIGTLVIAGAGSMARTGQTVGLYPAEMVASAILLAGFLMAGTLEKGAAAVRARLGAARTKREDADTPTDRP
ncbi:MAG: hypothetical protein OEV43_01565 [Coriobacteriia bacterium]|nr:hypothetical protein [Coriobacteriia bacterium]